MAKKCLNDCCYNLVKQLAKKTQFLWNVDKYIKDASKAKDTECARMWKQIRKDEERHAEMLKKHITKLAKQGKFR